MIAQKGHVSGSTRKQECETMAPPGTSQYHEGVWCDREDRRPRELDSKLGMLAKIYLYRIPFNPNSMSTGPVDSVKHHENEKRLKHCVSILRPENSLENRVQQLLSLQGSHAYPPGLRATCVQVRIYLKSFTHISIPIG